MQDLAQTGLSGGGEGVDKGFLPTIQAKHGDLIKGADWTLEVVHTPGHFAGHIAFRHNDRLFSGDHVMDWSSTLISPPDGDLGAFMRSCDAILEQGAARLYPGHGLSIDTVEERLNWLIHHRRARETAIRDTLSSQPQSLFEITEQVYRDIDDQLLPAASRNVFAHLIDLVERNLAQASPNLGVDALFHD
jgi:hydroxyacylglutathione hydrolase